MEDGWFFLVVGAFFAGVLITAGAVTFDAKDGEIKFSGESFVRVDAEQEDVVNSCKRNLSDCRQGLEDIANLYIDDVIVPLLEDNSDNWCEVPVCDEWVESYEWQPCGFKECYQRVRECVSPYFIRRPC